MLKAIVIDDDASLFSFITNELKKGKDIEIVGYAANLETGNALIRSANPDLIFLDIDLPDGKGFELVHKDLRAEIVFITAFDEYALRAFSCAAIDYLLKPIDPDRLHESVSRFLQRRGNGEWKKRLDVFKNNQAMGTQEQRVVLKMNYGYEVVMISNIIHCRANGNYSEINLADGSQLISSKTLKEFESMLGSMGFFRCHQSHLINLQAIKAFKSFKSEIKLTTGDVVKLARSKQREFSELMEANRTV